MSDLDAKAREWVLMHAVDAALPDLVNHRVNELIRFVREAVEAEREAIARLGGGIAHAHHPNAETAVAAYVEAIRARKEGT